MYVNRHTLRLVGKQILNGSNRKGFPVISEIDKRRQGKKSHYKNKWFEEFIKSRKSIHDVELEASAATRDVSKLEKDFKSFKQEIAELASEIASEKKTLTATTLRQKSRGMKTKYGSRNRSYAKRNRNFWISSSSYGHVAPRSIV